MFINLSNHPSRLWGEEQLRQASLFGEIIDMPFPHVAPDADEEEIQALADEYVMKIMEMRYEDEVVVHVMGEMALTYAIVDRLKKKDIKCVASTTMRKVSEDANGQKISLFSFVRFREY